jgi:hypothetical protein
VAWDFITKLLKFKKLINNAQHDSILIITNKLTKFSYFLPYRKSSITKKLTYIFLRRIVVNYKFFKKIILDRDKLFILKF